MAFTRTFGRNVAFAASLITALTLTACGGSKEAAKPAAPAAAPAATATKEVKVGFVYVGPVGDGGWTFAHDNGRKAMIENLKKEGITVTTQQVESVKEGADSERVIRDLVPKATKSFSPPHSAIWTRHSKSHKPRPMYSSSMPRVTKTRQIWAPTHRAPMNQRI